MARATSSFPDPLSPFTSTVKLVVAIRPISCRRRTIDGLVPTSGDGLALPDMARDAASTTGSADAIKLGAMLAATPVSGRSPESCLRRVAAAIVSSGSWLPALRRPSHLRLRSERGLARLAQVDRLLEGDGSAIA